MTFFDNPLAPRKKGLQAKSAEIKAWTRALLDLNDDTAVTVAELACRDEGCPDVETVIGVLEPGTPIATVRIHAPMADVTRADVAEALDVTNAARTSKTGVL